MRLGGVEVRETTRYWERVAEWKTLRSSLVTLLRPRSNSSKTSINLNGKVNRFLVPRLTLLKKLVKRTMKSSLCELQGAVAVLAEIDQDVQRLLHRVQRPQGVQHLLKKATTSQL